MNPFTFTTLILWFLINMSASIKIHSHNLRVSSVLNRDSKQFGKKHLADTNDDTCWNSDQGSPQWIQIDFERLVTVEEIHLQFQGGFAGRECLIEGKKEPTENYTRIQEFYPDDVNSIQIFQLQSPTSVHILRLVFNNSTDFFGRVTIYKLDIKGVDS